jgi:hypothetical protein
MSPKPTTMRFTDDEKVLIDALAAHLSKETGIPHGRTAVVRHLLRKMGPPAKQGPEAAAVRRAHERLFGQRA